MIAMQNNLKVATAREFASAFFEEFARTSIVDVAAAAARGRIRDRRDWWVPVLFSRLRSGRLRYPSGFIGGDEAAWDNLGAMVRANQLTPVLGPGLADGLVGARREIAQRWAKRWQMPRPSRENGWFEPQRLMPLPNAAIHPCCPLLWTGFKTNRTRCNTPRPEPSCT